MNKLNNTKNNNHSVDLLQVLVNGVKPALGCTEPVAVGLAAAEAYKGVKGKIKNVVIKLSPNIFKNGMGVGIPGTKEMGLVFAAALGITCGDAALGLEVYRNVNDKAILEAEALIENGLVSIGIEGTKGNFYIEAEVTTENGKGICIIKDNHTNVVFVKANDKIIFQNTENETEVNSNSISDLGDLTLNDIREFVETVSFSDIRFMLDGVKLNMDIAKVGLDEKLGVGLGAAMNLLMSDGIIKKDVVNEARILTSAACDARMSGINMAVMSSAGSGNHGITAIIPPTVVCEHIGCDDEKLARTLAFSHLTTAYIKVFTGGLSPVCGCAVAAGVGASAAITWVLGGNNRQIGGAIKNMIGSIAGMVCDGAKGGCAFKLSTASSEAIIQAKLAMANVFINDLDGIINPGVEETIKNLGRFCTDGMKDADSEIISIMLG